MTSQALIKQSDLNRMAAVPKQHGVCVEVEVDGMIIRIRPHEPVPDSEQIDRGKHICQ